MMLDVQNLSVSYGRRTVLRNVTLTFGPGKLYGILGENGSGKTTLLHALARQIKSTGAMQLNGAEYPSISPRDFAKKLSLLPQHRPLPRLSVYDLVACGRYPHQDFSYKLTSQDHQAVRRSLELTDMLGYAQRNLQKLSGGEQQRAYIAMLVAQDTPYILLDEPTTHLDVSSSFALMRLLCRMRDEGRCVLAVLHDLPLALRYADECVLLKDGEVFAKGRPDTLVSSKSIDQCFHVHCTKLEDRYIVDE